MKLPKTKAFLMQLVSQPNSTLLFLRWKQKVILFFALFLQANQLHVKISQTMAFWKWGQQINNHWLCFIFPELFEDYISNLATIQGIDLSEDSSPPIASQLMATAYSPPPPSFQNTPSPPIIPPIQITLWPTPTPNVHSPSPTPTDFENHPPPLTNLDDQLPPPQHSCC